MPTVSIQLDHHNPKGKGYWKCNNSVFRNDQFCKEIKEYLNNLITEQKDNPITTWWDKLKCKAKNFIIHHCFQKKQKRQIQIKQLKKELRNIINNDQQNKEGKIQSIKEELKLLENNLIEGATIRSRAETLKNNERPNKYFFRLENQRQQHNTINSLTTEKGVITETKPILQECETFFKELYQKGNTYSSLQNIFLKYTDEINKNHHEKLSKEITIEECWRAINSLNDNKAPGLDGLGKEFYKICFPILAEPLVKMINESAEYGLPKSMYRGIIKLIPKKTKPMTLKEYRPITLLNFDYKIITKIISSRLTQAVNTIISSEQSCALPNRRIHDNVHYIRNVIDYINQKNIAGSIITIDMDHAFDRLDHQYMFSVLQKMNISERILDLIKTCYQYMTSTVLVNGHFTNLINIQRAVRQGCPLSMLLFIIAIDPLIKAINTDRKIKGLTIPSVKKEAKVMAHADDITCVCTDERSITQLMHKIQLFEKASGLKINMQKTKAMKIGRWRNQNLYPHNGIQWVDSTRILGIEFGLAEEQWNQKFTNIVEKCTKIANDTKSRDISFCGKATIYNLKMCSKLQYLANFIPIPNKIIRKIETIGYKELIWNGKPDKIKRSILINKIEEGGINACNLEAKIQAHLLNHISEIIKETDKLWAPLARYWMGFKLRKINKNLDSNQAPRSWFATDFYSKAGNTFDIFQTQNPDFNWTTATCKSIYETILKGKKQIPHICRTEPGTDHTLKWKFIKCIRAHPKVKDMHWLMSHNILPTGHYLHSHHIIGNNEANCKICGENETIEHVLYNCNYIKPIWTKIQNILQKCNNCSSIPLTITTATFAEAEYWCTQCQHILAETRYGIWTARNEARFDNRKLTTIGIHCRVMWRLRKTVMTWRGVLSRRDFNQKWKIYNLIPEENAGKL